MKTDFLSDTRSVLSRRSFVQGLALGGVVAGTGLWRASDALAAPVRAMAASELRGTDLATARFAARLRSVSWKDSRAFTSASSSRSTRAVRQWKSRLLTCTSPNM